MRTAKRPQSKPRIWNAFVVPSALGIFYCIVLGLSYQHLASAFPIHFNAAGAPDRWQTTGPVLLATLVAVWLIFLVLGTSLIYSADKRHAWWIVGLVYAGVMGVAVGAFTEFVGALRSLQAPHILPLIGELAAWGVAAIVAEFLFLLIPRWPLPQASGGARA